MLGDPRNPARLRRVVLRQSRGGKTVAGTEAELSCRATERRRSPAAAPATPSEPGCRRFTASGRGGIGGERRRLLLRLRAQSAEHGRQLLDRGLQFRKRHGTANFGVVDGLLLRGSGAHRCLECLGGCAHRRLERLSNIRQSADSIEAGQMSLLKGCDQLRKSSRQLPILPPDTGSSLLPLSNDTTRRRRPISSGRRSAAQ